MTTDRDEEFSWWDELHTLPSDDEEARRPRPSPLLPPEESISAFDRVRSLFRLPPLGEREPPPAPPTLRSTAAELLRSAGLFGVTPAAGGSATIANGPIAAIDGIRPPSWKLPSRASLPALLDEVTSAGPPVGAGPNNALTPSANDARGAAAVPREPMSPGAPAPLDHPNARTGLALTAADSLLTKGIDLAVSLAAGDPAVARKLVELGADVLSGALPEPFRASALASAADAAAEAERRVGENERAARTRAALGALANRRAEAEHEHAAAILSGDRRKIAVARRDAIDAWSAERRARGDGEAEISAGARAMEAQLRRAALQHSVAQLTEAEQERFAERDPDAKADPAAARALIEASRRLRREDPARAGEATVEREIEARKRDGRIDSAKEETATRYKLRLDAQARRGIPEHRRRILTNDERTRVAAEYLRIESRQGKAEADRWLDEAARVSGAYAQRFKAELAAPSRSQAPPAPVQTPSGQHRDPAERVDTASDSPNTAMPAPPMAGDLTALRDAQAVAHETLRRNVEADADTLERDYDPDQKPGHPSRIKRAFALLKYADDPAFDDLARTYDYDPARLRAIARLLTAKPGDYAALVKDLQDENGPINDFAFVTLYRTLARDLIGTGASADGKPVPGEDRRISAVLYLLGHDLSSAARGQLARDSDVNSAPLGQMFQAVLEELGLPPEIAALAAIRGRQRGAATNPPGTVLAALPPSRQIRINKRNGAKAEKFAAREIKAELEEFGLQIGPKSRATVAGDGSTYPDLQLRTKSGQIAMYVEVKDGAARFNSANQERRQAALGVFLFRVNRKDGTIEIYKPPYGESDSISRAEWREHLRKASAQRNR